MSSLPFLADAKPKSRFPRFHSRLQDGPDWLAGFLSHRSQESMTDAEACGIRARIIDYCDGAIEHEDLRPIADALRETLLQQFEDWRHRITRMRYQEYLVTEGWERTRAKVLERAQWVCEGCRERRATQVHHLNYDDPRGDEMLFNLVALCGACHDKISARQKTGE